MRTSPASHFRQRKIGPVCNSVPRIGTKLRSIYDLFISSKGQVIDFVAAHERPLSDLQDYYGLDIRRISRGRWVLAGEWFGRVYLDYVAEHLASEQEGIA
jgi:hypothetical protein